MECLKYLCVKYSLIFKRTNRKCETLLKIKYPKWMYTIMLGQLCQEFKQYVIMLSFNLCTVFNQIMAYVNNFYMEPMS